MKLIYLYYDYLQYKLRKKNKGLLALHERIDHLEVTYMHKEKPEWDWKKIEREAEGHFKGFEDIKINPTISVSDDIHKVVEDKLKIVHNKLGNVE